VQRATDAGGDPRRHLALARVPAPEPRPLGWIGHAGLAGTRCGAAPTRDTVSAADLLDLDWLELDLCATRDGELVLRHHGRLPGGRPVQGLTLAELRRVEPGILTLSDAAEQLGGRVALLLDVKSARVVDPLVAWLTIHRGEGLHAVCSESPDALARLRDRAGWAPRWRSLTALWRWTAETIPPWLRPFVRDFFPGAVSNMADGVADAGSDAAAALTTLLGTEQLSERVRRMCATAERDRLPPCLSALAGEVGAVAVSVDHWAITPALCEEARRLDVLVAAWTVNRIEVALELARTGVDLITSDHVATMRPAVQALSRADPGPPTGATIAVRCRPPAAAPDAPRLHPVDALAVPVG
jgi:glycerophosphoryl diester phosphodiesterase